MQSRVRSLTVLSIAVTVAACSGAIGDPIASEGSGATFDEAGNPTPHALLTVTEGEGDRPHPGSPGAPGTADAGSSLDAGAPGGVVPSDAGSAGPPSTKGSALLASEARREVAAMISSRYQHTTLVDESVGTFDYDCSGFVDYALGRVVPDALTVLQTASSPRPLAADFESFFAAISAGSAKGRWRSVGRATDLVPGDVVAWVRPADVTSSNTGHVMIVREAPTPNPKRVDEVLVPITDSTSTPHGPADSRSAAGTDGLGTGTIGLLVDGAGVPLGYRWTGGYSSHDELTAVALGHLE